MWGRVRKHACSIIGRAVAGMGVVITRHHLYVRGHIPTGKRATRECLVRRSCRREVRLTIGVVAVSVLIVYIPTKGSIDISLLGRYSVEV
jgi:hypothetical protein